jgi:hypothetical protein
MSRLWLRMLVFVVPLAFGWTFLEWGMLRVTNSASWKRERLHAIASEVDTLILGSSEAYYGIEPRHLSGTAFNLANTSQSLYYDQQLVEKVLGELPRLRRVIVPVSYFTLYFQLHDHLESWRQYQYSQEWYIPLQRPIDAGNVRLWSRVALYTPRTALEALRKRFRLNLAPRVDDRGWYRVPDEDRWGLGPDEARGRIAVHHGFMHDEYLPENSAILDRLITTLRARGIEVVIVTTPVWPTYEAGMRPETWARARAVAEELSRKHGVRYLNFLHEPRMTAEDFEDSDHLDADGAVHFAQILDAALGPVASQASGR